MSSERVLYAELDAILRIVGARRQSRDLERLLGVIGIRVLALEVERHAQLSR